jgi:tRNA(His) guanylyltransferase
MSEPIGDRMKRYEHASKTTLTWRMPVIIRIDGRAFHTYTSGLDRPFCEKFIHAMNLTAQAVCEDAQGAALAYVQSDEISILLHGYRRLDSRPWFENEVQKIVSIAAGLASATFTAASTPLFGRIKPACFDARAFVLPESEVNNYFLWRQQDATRNAIQMTAHAHYSQRALHGKNRDDMRAMLLAKGIDFEAQPTHHRRGRCLFRESFEEKDAVRHRWVVDNQIPIFKEDPSYVERHLVVLPE